jgi:FKBP-type peptidyl-prolyl cis-trans isomerase 2
MKMAGGIRSGAVFQPLTFPVGAGKMIPGFDKEVQGMKIGESKSFVVSPEEGYGPAYKSEWVPRDAFEAIVSKKIPKVEVTEVPVAFWTSNNKPLPKVGEQVSDGGTVGKVLSVSNSSVTVSVENNLATVFGTGFQKV